jgi:anti-anti-sigma factor
MTRESGLVVVRIHGDLDAYGTMQVKEAFSVAIPDRTAHVVVDLSEVPFLTSAALAMLVVRAQAMARAGGSLHIAGARERVLEVFERAGFTLIFPLYPTLEAACAALEVPTGQLGRRLRLRADGVVLKETKPGD